MPITFFDSELKHGQRRTRRGARRGAAVVEMAIVAPIVFVVIFGFIVFAQGVFRNNQVASLAQEGARWAAVHGRVYAQRNRTQLPTSDDVALIIHQRAVGLDMERLSCELAWGPDHRALSVTVRYRWAPKVFFGGLEFVHTAESIAYH